MSPATGLVVISVMGEGIGDVVRQDVASYCNLLLVYFLILPRWPIIEASFHLIM